MATQAVLHDLAMPRLSDSMEEGTILSWLKQVGDEIAVGEEIAEIETDKANMGFESDVAGTLVEILVGEGETAAVGAVIARIGDPDAIAAPGPRVKASPLARRLARERDVDLAGIQGTGPGGRIVRADVEAASAQHGPPPASPAEPVRRIPAAAAAGEAAVETAKGEVRVETPTSLQATVARRMAESKATAPHFYLRAEIEMTRAVAARRAIKAASRDGEVVPSFNDMVVKACAIALREFPKANGAYRDGRFELHSRVNVGIAVAAPGALVVPTIFDADRKGLRQIAGDARGLSAKVREATITPPELSGGTFTVSNLGMFGIDSFDAVVNSPQAGILAVGAIREVPAFRDGELVAAQMMEVTLSCDHRILYGAEGAEFLARVKALLEEPVQLAL